MEEQPRRNNRGEATEKDLGEEIMEESWRRDRGGGIIEGEPWRMHHGGIIIEKAARRRQSGGGSHQRESPDSQEAPRSVSVSVSVCVCICSGPVTFRMCF